MEQCGNIPGAFLWTDKHLIPNFPNKGSMAGSTVIAAQHSHLGFATTSPLLEQQLRRVPPAK
jgi:hypothetical protein